MRAFTLTRLALVLCGLLVNGALRPNGGVTLFLKLRPPTTRYNGTVPLRLNATLTCRHRALARAVRRAYCGPLI